MNLGVSYARVSTVAQEENYSIATQQEAIRAYAKGKGIQIQEEIVDVASAASLDRPGLDRLRSIASMPGIQHVIVYCVDRLSREPAGYYYLKTELARFGVTLHYVNKGEVQNTADGVLLDGVDVLLAQMERLRIAERTKRGRKAKVESGKVLGHGLMPMYGYHWEGKRRDKQLIVNDEEAEIVRIMFSWYLNEGLSLRGITTKLTEMKVPTPGDTGRHVTRRQRGFGEWGVTTVRRIMTNTAYTGTYYHYQYSRSQEGKVSRRDQSEWIPVTIPAIISKELFDAVQAKLAQGRSLSKRNSKHNYLLGRRIRCECGRALGGEISKNFRCYRCTARDRTAIRTCSLGSVKADLVEVIVWHWLVQKLNPDTLRAGIERETEYADIRRKELGQQLAVQRQHYAELETRLQRIRDAIVAGVFTPEEARDEKGKVEMAKRSVEQEIERLEQSYSSAGPSMQDLECLMAYAKELHEEAAFIDDFERQRWLVDKLQVQVTVFRNEEGKRHIRVQALLTTSPEILPLDGIDYTTLAHYVHLPQPPPAHA